MTYCVGVLLDDGLILAADTRTNAGVDHIMTVRKIFTFEEPGDRAIILLTAGNLAITQAIVTLLRENTRKRDETTNIMAATSMYRVARVVGNAVREVHGTDAEHLRKHSTDFVCSFLLAGQVKGGTTRLFNVYAAGNFIEATRDTPFMQIGETKYGKPVLDRLVDPKMSLEDAAKCALISYSATIRSNVSVGLPIDLLAYRKDSLRIGARLTIEEGDEYYGKLSTTWSNALQKAFDDIPPPPLEGLR